MGEKGEEEKKEKEREQKPKRYLVSGICALFLSAEESQLGFPVGQPDGLVASQMVSEARRWSDGKPHVFRRQPDCSEASQMV